MRHFYTLRCTAPLWLTQCKPYRNRLITAKVIDKSLGARFFIAHCVCKMGQITNKLADLL